MPWPILWVTRNTHAHLCLAPASVQTMRAHLMWVQVRRVWHVLHLLYRRSCLVLVVFKPRWPRCVVITDLHLHCQRTLSSAHLSVQSISECVIYGLYLVPMVCNDIPHDIPEYVRTYIRMYIRTL